METKFIEKATGALADKYRLTILQEIAKRGSLPCAAIQELTGLSQPCVSHHIKILAESDLIITHKEGRCLNLQINQETMQQLSLFIEQLGVRTKQEQE